MESCFSLWVVRQHFKMPTSSLLCFLPIPPTPRQMQVCTHTHTHTRATPSPRYSTVTWNHWPPLGLFLECQSKLWLEPCRFAQTDAILFVAVIPGGHAGCCSDHANLPVKKFYKIGFTHRICGVSVSWCSYDSIESSGLSCPLRCQFHVLVPYKLRFLLECRWYSIYRIIYYQLSYISVNLHSLK